MAAGVVRSDELFTVSSSVVIACSDIINVHSQSAASYIDSRKVGSMLLVGSQRLGKAWVQGVGGQGPRYCYPHHVFFCILGSPD